MARLRFIFILSALAALAGCNNRCYLACTDQTGIQNDYLADRDNCRGYAQDKIDLLMRDSPTQDDRTRKGHLVSLFSQCMAGKNWTVPDGKGEGKGDKPVLAASPAAPAGLPAAPVIDKATERSLLQRAAECALARQYAASSVTYAARAEACDLECAEGLRLGPDAPRPASCLPSFPPKATKGVDKW